MVKKHVANIEPAFTVEKLALLFADCKISLENNLNFPDHIRVPLKEFNAVCSDSMGEEINLLYDALTSSGDIDTFYSKFYITFVSQGSMYFPTLISPVANLLMKKIGEKVVETINVEHKDKANPFEVPLKENEIDVLQHLSSSSLF